MAGGYVIFDEKLAQEIYDNAQSGAESMEWKGAYDYIKAIVDTKKVVIKPQIRKRLDGVNVISNSQILGVFSVTVDVAYPRISVQDLDGFVYSVSSIAPDEIEFIQI